MKKIFSILVTTFLVVILTGCQVAPIKSETTFTNDKGEGSKTIYLAAFVDGSCQLVKNGKQQGDNWFTPEISNPNPSDNAFECDAKYTTTAKDGIINVPGKADASIQERWDAVNNYVTSLKLDGYDIKVTEIQSSTWQDEMMNDNSLNADAKAWKAYVYQLTYSWKDINEYIQKTKNLIGTEAWEMSDLKEMEASGQKWAEWTTKKDTCKDGEGKCNVVTFTEKESVVYWSTFNLLKNFYDSEYFNVNAYGADYPITFDGQYFTISDINYKIGDANAQFEVSHMDDLDEGGNETLTITGEFKVKSNGLMYIIAGLVAAVLVGVGIVVLNKKKK